MPKDRVTMNHQGYGFVEFLGEDDADYAIKIMNMIKLYGKPIRVNKVRNDSDAFAIGINDYFDLLFVPQPVPFLVLPREWSVRGLEVWFYL